MPSNAGLSATYNDTPEQLVGLGSTEYEAGFHVGYCGGDYHNPWGVRSFPRGCMDPKRRLQFTAYRNGYDAGKRQGAVDAWEKYETSARE